MITQRLLFTSASFLLSISSRLHAQSTSDCAGAIPLCGGIYTELAAPLGSGNVYEFTGICNANNETSSLWYTFTVQDPGNLSFVLDPANDADDYDWGLFDITEGGCAGITAQDGSSPEVNCNSYGSLSGNGPTGISSTNGGSGTSNGPGDLNGPAFNADLPVVVGHTYALVVMNWSNSPDGYTIDFNQSTATIFDDLAPIPTVIFPECGNQTFRVEFSEPIVTSTVEPTDFSVTTPAGETILFSDVTPDDPLAFAQPGYTLTLPVSLLEPGTHILTITALSENVEDPCGNIALDTLLEFNVDAPISYDVNIVPACNGSNGSVTATYLSGGEAPVTFTLAGSPLASGVPRDLGPGEYSLWVEDAAGCQFVDVAVVPNQEIDVLIPFVQDSLSCSTPSVVIEGVQVVPAQDVSYSWTAVTSDGGTGFSSSDPSPMVSQAGLYTVVVTEPLYGCTDEASVLISNTSAPTVDLGQIALPNVVSPNSDGRNDSWRPFVPSDPALDITSLFDEFELTILDRWGQVVHTAKEGGQRGWNANDVADGTYFYTMSYRAECGTVIDEERTGTITVLR